MRLREGVRNRLNRLAKPAQTRQLRRS
jgi:hypothetical protein